MTVIAKNDRCDALWRAVLGAVAARLRERGVHPGRTVVLLPYAQLMPWAERYWTALEPAGFVPKFQTTRNWAQQLSAWLPQGDDFAGDVARDVLTAQALLDRAGLASQRDLLAAALREAAAQLAPAVAAVEPGARAQWAHEARALVPLPDEASPMRYEAAVARLALEWVVASRHPTDVLFQDGVRGSVDALVILQGFQPDPMAVALARRWGDACTVLSLVDADMSNPGSPDATGMVALHTATDGEDEAQRAAACVIRHLDAGRVPVALAANDRALTRRIGAHLATADVSVRDENGWILSTTRAASQLMALLQSGVWNATTDAVLDALKHLPAVSGSALMVLERLARRRALATWAAVAQADWSRQPDVAALVTQAEAWRAQLRGSRSLSAWCASVRSLLADTGLWAVLEADPAGTRVLAALRLPAGREDEAEGWQGAARPIDLAGWTRWARDVLEAARYVPALQGHAPVVVLPLSQLLARPFGALVLPGCDERRLPLAPDPPGAWTGAQRAAWGLADRPALEAAQRVAWQSALQIPAVDVLWRTGDDGGEPVLPSPLVLALQLDGAGHAGADGRCERQVDARPTPRPQPVGRRLPVQRLSSTAYADLRHCPYRFFALRQLGLQEPDELTAEVDKRDFGNWLHAVLQQFHEASQAEPADALAARSALMDAAAQAVTAQQGLDAGDFLPFAAGWPQVRDGYLQWLAAHEQTGARFLQAERAATQSLGDLQLLGTLDRVDAVTEGGAVTPLVMDYKTENDAVTARRIKAGMEDTQLAFYAALLSDDTVRAAYVNVGDRDGTRMHEQPDVVAMRDVLIEGIRHDVSRIAAGDPLPALGEGAVCDYCAARGLCRKDFWND